MFLRARVLEIRDHFQLSSISTLIVATNDIEGFRRWMRRNYMFMSVRDEARLACRVDGLDYYLKIYYTRREQPTVDKIIKKWKIHDPNPTPFLDKVNNWLIFHFGNFTGF